MGEKPASGDVDPRIRRTRQLLHGALVRLLNEKRFDEISVQDIADAATVNRATFYSHYTDKFCLLECVVAERFNQLLADRQVEYDRSCTSGLRAVVLAACDYLAGLLPEPDRRIEPQMETAVIAVLRAILLGGLEQHGPADPARKKMVASAAAWALFGAAREWAAAQDRTSSEEVADTIAGLIAPVLHNVMSPATGDVKHSRKPRKPAG